MRENPNLSRTLKATFYNMSRRYGSNGRVSRHSDVSTDYTTGAVTRTVQSRSIRQMVQVPVTVTRSLLYTATMMQAIRPFAWQGSPGQNTETSVFLILDNDIRGWGVITPDQWIDYNGGRFEIIEAVNTSGGWIIEAKRVRGAADSLELTVDSDSGLSGEATRTVE